MLDLATLLIRCFLVSVVPVLCQYRVSPPEFAAAEGCRRCGRQPVYIFGGLAVKGVAIRVFAAGVAAV